MRFNTFLALELKRVRANADDERPNNWSAADEAWYQRMTEKDQPRLRRLYRRHPEVRPKKAPRRPFQQTSNATPFEAGMQATIDRYWRHRRAPEPKKPPPPLNLSTPARERRAREAAAARAADVPMYGRTQAANTLRDRTPEPKYRNTPRRTFRTMTPVANPKPGRPDVRLGRVPRSNMPVGPFAGDPRVRAPGSVPGTPRFRPIIANEQNSPLPDRFGILRTPQERRRIEREQRASQRRMRRPATKFADMLDLELKALGAAPLAGVTMPAAVRQPQRLPRQRRRRMRLGAGPALAY